MRHGIKLKKQNNICKRRKATYAVKQQPLIIYGIIPTLQSASASFGKVYAAYGGIFIVLSILWGGGGEIDGTVPDTYDLIGGLVALIGVAIIMYAPRG